MSQGARSIHRVKTVIRVFFVILVALLIFGLMVVAVAFSEPEHYGAGALCLIAGIGPILYLTYRITMLKKELIKKNAVTDYLLRRKQAKIEDIASFLGTTPEKAYEELMSLKEEGYLSFSLDNETGIYTISQFGDHGPRAADLRVEIPEDYDSDEDTGSEPFEVR